MFSRINWISSFSWQCRMHFPSDVRNSSSSTVYTHTCGHAHRHLPFQPSIKGKMSWGLSCTFFFFSFLFYSHCFNQAFFIICLPFSFSLQAGNLVLEHSLGCQAISFSLFRFSGKNVAHPFTLSPWHKSEPTLKTRLIRHYQIKQQRWRIKHQPSSLYHPSLRAESWSKLFSTVLFIWCEWIWTGYSI